MFQDLVQVSAVVKGKQRWKDFVPGKVPSGAQHCYAQKRIGVWFIPSVVSVRRLKARRGIASPSVGFLTWWSSWQSLTIDYRS